MVFLKKIFYPDVETWGLTPKILSEMLTGRLDLILCSSEQRLTSYLPSFDYTFRVAGPGRPHVVKCPGHIFPAPALLSHGGTLAKKGLLPFPLGLQSLLLLSIVHTSSFI